MSSMAVTPFLAGYLWSRIRRSLSIHDLIDPRRAHDFRPEHDDQREAKDDGNEQPRNQEERPDSVEGSHSVAFHALYKNASDRRLCQSISARPRLQRLQSLVECENLESPAAYGNDVRSREASRPAA